ncbi:uncharacterized protein LOC126377584 [Pectinophora gossypiella]|uniref:uncharacterized protein LOC126377584 n=1 Tax=Pectinophora gossypiella TaxID=13191 RepID=UPI00214F60E7|nr:uncharacterized protein LOC126377584 [Pectinophora gossypiella]
MECLKCKKVLAKKGSHFVCQGPCQGTFHRNCVKGLSADIKKGKNRIYCNNCEDDEGSEEEEEEEDAQNYSKILKDIQKKVGVIPGLKKHLDSITQSLSLLSDKYDTLIAEHEQSKLKINKLEKTITNINNKCVFLEKCNTALEQKIHDFEQVSRKHNVEIVGIEQLPGENVKDIVSKIGAVIDVSSADIEWVRRSRPMKAGGKPAPIIVGFKSSGTESRDRWLANRRKLTATTSDMVTGGSASTKIYLNEDLTRNARVLLWNTKKQLHGTYKYIWVSNGKILVKKSDGDKSVCVRAESDISELLNKK